MPNAWPLPRSTAEAQGLPSQALENFVQAASQQVRDIHSLIVLRNGQVISEAYWAPYQRDQLHMLFSLTKSFVSTAVGFAISEGLLTLEDKVISFFAESELPSEISENLAAMSIHHLLSMNTGHENDQFSDPLNEFNWSRAFLCAPVPYKPGTHFVYNSGASYMLGVIVQQLTGQSLHEYLQPRLFGPLGITDFAWDRCERGFEIGGFGLELTTDSIARLGLLYLQRGEWQGQQILPAEWVERASSFQSDNRGPDNNEHDWAQGYGYQFWRTRPNAYRGDGAFGQYCIVLPEHNMVIAATSGTAEMHVLLDLMRKHLLPACADQALPEDAAAAASLERALAQARIQPVQGKASSPRAAALSGKTFVFEPENTVGTVALRFEFGDQLTTLVFSDERGTHTLELGVEQWHNSETTMVPPIGESGKVGAVGAWTDDDTFVADICFTGGPFRYAYTAHFVDDATVEYSCKINVGFGPREFAPALGKAQ
jgi:CubicO group peptidase (beta-lactamase class C family)